MAKRLIDSADLIAKLPVVEEDKQISLIGAVADVVTMISECKPVDAVEVVRCRDCRYASPLNDTEKLMYIDKCKVCYNGDAAIDGYNIVMPEHFCSYGERKGGQAPQREADDEES